MVDLETLLQPVFDDSPEPAPFVTVRTRARRVRRRRVARALVATVVLVGTFGAGTIAAVSGSRRDRLTVVTPSAPPTRLHVGTPAPVSAYGIDMLSAFGSIWVTRPDHVVRFDAATGRALATIAVPGTSDSRNLAAGAGSIWVDDTGTQKVTRIDPAGNTVAATIRLPDAALVVDGLAFVDGKLWIVRPAPNDDSRGDVVSVDPATNRVAQRANIPRTFDVMAGGNHALWYVRGTDLLRFDTETIEVTIVRHDVKSVLAVANLHLWLLTAAGVIETDELNGSQFGPTIPVVDQANVTVAEGGDAVWIAGQRDSSTAGSVTPYDLVTHRPLATPTPIGFPISAMSALDTNLWVDAGGVTRIPYSRRSAPHAGPSEPTTVASTAPRTEPCIFQHAPDDLYSLAQPATITLPGGDAIPIVRGNPISEPDGITLDSEGATYPGQAGPAASLFWGAATEGGPFAGLDHAAVGDVVTLRQTVDAGNAGATDCVQHWRIVRIFEPPVRTWTEPTLLRLVGFTPHGSLGPTVRFYVDAVPA